MALILRTDCKECLIILKVFLNDTISNAEVMHIASSEVVEKIVINFHWVKGLSGMRWS